MSSFNRNMKEDVGCALQHPAESCSSSGSSSSSIKESRFNSSSISSNDGSCSSCSSNSSKDSTSSTSTSDSSCGFAKTLEIQALRDAAAAAHSSSNTRGISWPSLSSYWFSPFSFFYMFCFACQIIFSFLFGGIVGWPFAASFALLPQQLLRLFTFGGCGLLLLYDCFYGLRWVSTRRLLQERRKWVQEQLYLLLQVYPRQTRETIAGERLRTQQLVAALRRSLAAADTHTHSAAAPAPSAPSAPPAADQAAALADAAAQVAVGGDLRMAAALYGMSKDTIAAALAAARQQHAEASKERQKQQRSFLEAAAAGGAAARSLAWAAAKRMATFVGCVLLIVVCVDIPANAAAAAWVAARWMKLLHPWLLPLLHATARGCMAAALANLNVGAFNDLAIASPINCISISNSISNSNSNSNSNSSSNNSSDGKCRNGVGCVFERPPKRWNLRLRLCFCFFFTLCVSFIAALGSSAAARGNEWRLSDLLQIPLAVVQLSLQLLPPEVSSLLPLRHQRSAAADRLLLLLKRLRWPKKGYTSEVLLPATLLTVAAAVISCCSSPPPLWREHAYLEQEAATRAVRKLLGARRLQLQTQHLCARISRKCRWAWEAALLRAKKVPIQLGRIVRSACVFMVGLLWILLLVSAVSDLPLLRTDEGELQTPLQMMKEQLKRSEVRLAWQELKELKRELTRRSNEEGYEKAFEWLLQMVQDSWEQHLEAQKNESDAYVQALELFNLTENATAFEIRQRYRQLAKQFHPDLAASTGGIQGQEVGAQACQEANDPDASEACKASHEFMQKINLAYEVLLGQAGGKAAGLRGSEE